MTRGCASGSLLTADPGVFASLVIPTYSEWSVTPKYALRSGLGCRSAAGAGAGAGAGGGASAAFLGASFASAFLGGGGGSAAFCPQPPSVRTVMAETASANARGTVMSASHFANLTSNEDLAVLSGQNAPSLWLPKACPMPPPEHRAASTPTATPPGTGRRRASYFPGARNSRTHNEIIVGG